MSRALASLVSMLGAGMAGYGQGQQIARQNARQDRMDAQQQEEYDYQKGLRTKAQALDNDISAAMADRTLETVAPPEMSNADISMAAPDTPQYRVGEQTYADEGQARAALLGVNSKASKYQRAAAAAAGYGAAGLDKAAQYDAFAKHALDEGTDQVLSAIQSGAPSLDAVKKAGGTVSGTVGQQAADIFNQTGGRWKVSPDTKVEHYIDKDAAGREFVNSRVLGADGKPIVDDVKHAGLMLQDYKTRLAAQQNDMVAGQKSQELDLQGIRTSEDMRHNRAVEDETRSNNQAQRGIQAGQLKLAQDKEARDAQLFKNQTIDGQLDEIKKAVGPLTAADEQAYRKKLLGIGQSKADDATFINDVTKKWAENNPTAGAAEVAKFRAGLQTSLVQAGNNSVVEQRLKTEFAKHAPGTPGYAQTWNDAKSDLGMTDAQLSALGYAPPAAAVAPRAALRGTTPRIPGPPTEKVWIGNTFTENPAYAEWKRRYGDAYRQQEAAANARFAASYALDTHN